MKDRFSNRKQENFLIRLGEFPSLEDENDDLTRRCKFNFSYFDASQEAGQDFRDWDHPQLCKLLDKLKEYSRESLDYWRTQRCGRGGRKVLEVYGIFPRKSSFSQPKHVPHQAEWGRFRLENMVRLVGFVVPAELHRTPHCQTNELFDKNTFYIVFLDRDHNFYQTEQR